MHNGTLDSYQYKLNDLYQFQVEAEATEYAQWLIGFIEAGKRITAGTLARLRREVEGHVLSVMRKQIEEQRAKLQDTAEYLASYQRKWTENDKMKGNE